MIGQGNKHGDLATRRPFAGGLDPPRGRCLHRSRRAEPPRRPWSARTTRAVVAYINENEPITRQELGEYLIARDGAEKIELLVNRRVIDLACRARGIEVTGGEVEAALGDDLKGLNVDAPTLRQGDAQGLPQEPLRVEGRHPPPQAAPHQAVPGRINRDLDEIAAAFDATYGEKIDCRDHPLAQGSGRRREGRLLALATARKRSRSRPRAGAATWRRPAARSSPSPAAAWDCRTSKREAFTLKPGEVSRLIGTPEGVIVLKCDRRIPADTTVNPEKVRDELVKQIKARKVQAQIPKLFQELRMRAAPKTQLPGRVARKIRSKHASRRPLSPRSRRRTRNP